MPFPPSSHAVWIEVDTDGDGIMDSGYDDGNPPPDPDVDLDGLTETQELALGTQVGDPDTDDDGALDGSEVNIMGTDPLDPDSNDNGINDYDEYCLKESDSDSDSLCDWDEIYLHSTNPGLVDTDGDGWSDGDEVNVTGTSPINSDTDGDGLMDWDDYLATNDPNGDYDDDGLSNLDESVATYPYSLEWARTQIRVFDTDGDGLSDGYETSTQRLRPNGPGFETKLASHPLLADSDPMNSWTDFEDPQYRFPSELPQFAITAPASLPGATIGENYMSPEFVTVHSGGPCSWSVVTGELPPGLSFNGAYIAGMPVSTGAYSFTVRGTDESQHVTTADYTLVVGYPPPTIVSSATLPSASTGGSYYSWSFSANGGSSGYSWSIESGALPSGINLESNGTLVGYASTAGNFPFVIRVTDSNGQTCDQSASLEVTEAASPPVSLGITSSSILSDGQTGSWYWWSFSAGGGSGDYSWSLLNGSLPDGLSLTSNGGLSGTLLAGGGTYSFTVAVTDENSNSTSQEVSLTVIEVPPPLEILSGSTFTCSMWTPVTISFVSSDSGAAHWSADSLPAGWSIDASGLLTGVLADQDVSFNVTVTNGGSSDTKTIYLTVVDQDADGDGLSASQEHDLAVSLGRPIHDADAASNGGGNPAPSDWLVHYFNGPVVDDTAADSDGDGLGPELEIWLGTDPSQADSDGDFYSDRFNLYWVYDCFTDLADADEDGLHAAFESLLGTSDLLTDSDGDGLTDAWEASYIHYSHPSFMDTDGDGLDDGDELDHQTQAREIDTDQDHLTDHEEVLAQTIFGINFPLSPLRPDTDFDGIPDYAEVDLTDTDGAGIPDRLEAFWGLDKDNPDDEGWDLDSDGTTNVAAYQNGYDIFASWQPQFDHDADGMDDIYELAHPGIMNMYDQRDGADDPDADFLTNAEEYRFATHPENPLSPAPASGRKQIIELHDSTGVPLRDQQNNVILRPAASDLEQALGSEVLISSLVRDNGTQDASRAFDDDWDQDGISNYDELYPPSGAASDPRSYDAPVQLPAASLPPAGTAVVEPYMALLQASGGFAPYVYGLTSGTLPDGFTLSEGGQISGQPTSAGQYSFQVTVTDARGGTATTTYELTVYPPPQTMSPTTVYAGVGGPQDLSIPVEVEQGAPHPISLRSFQRPTKPGCL